MDKSKPFFNRKWWRKEAILPLKNDNFVRAGAWSRDNPWCVVPVVSKLRLLQREPRERCARDSGGHFSSVSQAFSAVMYRIFGLIWVYCGPSNIFSAVYGKYCADSAVFIVAILIKFVFKMMNFVFILMNCALSPGQLLHGKGLHRAIYDWFSTDSLWFYTDFLLTSEWLLIFDWFSVDFLLIFYWAPSDCWSMLTQVLGTSSFQTFLFCIIWNCQKWDFYWSSTVFHCYSTVFRPFFDRFATVLPLIWVESETQG